MGFEQGARGLTANLDSYILEDGYISQFSAQRAMASMCLLYLCFPGFTETCSDVERARLAADGCYAFQDYAIAHWADHVAAIANRGVEDTVGSARVFCPSAQDDGILDAFLLFGLRYQADLELGLQASIDGDPLPAGLAELTTPEYLLCIRTLWHHVMAVRVRTGDNRDQVSLPSLANALNSNRQILEKLWENPVARGPRAVDFYGRSWFKCNRLSCYYFHEGFPSKTARRDHYGRHERPFRCEADDDCPGAVAGFASLSELEKHKRNLHPGIDKLSSTFARLKKGRGGKDKEAKYPCPRCSQRFKTRLDCRSHLMSHWSQLQPKGR